MAAHSDSSSDPTPTRSLDSVGGAAGSTAVGAHSAGARPSDEPTRSTTDSPTTRYTPVDRTATAPASTLPPAAAAGTGTHTGTDRDADQHRGLDRSGRQQAVAAQKERYGGISWGSAFFGWLSANGMAVLLIALLSAGGLALGLSDTVSSADEAADNAASGIGLGAGIALLVVLFLAYLAGGYVAGRMARFDGVKQGVAVWVIGLLVVLLLALAGLVFGSEYNVLSQLNLPRIPVDEGTLTTAGIIALVAVLIATLVGAVLGGQLGARYHRKVDRVGFDAV